MKPPAVVKKETPRASSIMYHLSSEAREESIDFVFIASSSILGKAAIETSDIFLAFGGRAILSHALNRAQVVTDRTVRLLVEEDGG